MPVLFNHGIVIGGSIAGLLASRVLLEYCDQITILERDQLPQAHGPRKGVPQARHIHVMLARGQIILEKLFPGLSEELEAAGAPKVDWTQDCLWLTVDGSPPRYASGIESISSSRDLLEWTIRQRLASEPRLRIIDCAQVTGLAGSLESNYIEGVRVKHLGARERSDEEEELIPGDLILDASGRNSRVCEWLGKIGYPRPEETMVNSFHGYSSRWYQPPPGFHPDWKVLVLKNTPPVNPRGGGIYIIEKDQWIVTLAGAGGDYPPTREADFLEFSHSLVDPYLYDLIKAAKPLTRIHGFQQMENRLRHFEKMPRWPQNLMVLGDAVCTFNPAYGQGMTVAALHAITLDEILQSQAAGGKTNGNRPARDNVARLFQSQLAKVNETPWIMATAEDFHWPTTEGKPPNFIVRRLQWYIDRIGDLSLYDVDVHRAFTEVAHLLKPPRELFHPEHLKKVSRLVVGRQSRPKDENGWVNAIDNIADEGEVLRKR